MRPPYWAVNGRTSLLGFRSGAPGWCVASPAGPGASLSPHRSGITPRPRVAGPRMTGSSFSSLILRSSSHSSVRRSPSSKAPRRTMKPAVARDRAWECSFTSAPSGAGPGLGSLAFAQSCTAPRIATRRSNSLGSTPAATPLSPPPARVTGRPGRTTRQMPQHNLVGAGGPPHGSR